MVSIHTDTEITALADFMSGFTDIGGSKTVNGRPYEDSTEPYSSVISSSTSDAVSSPDTSSSVSVTVSYSDSDNHHSSDEHPDTNSTNAHYRQRLPRIYTDSIHGSAPSLISSASYSSNSTGRYTSPTTPLTSSTELSSDLAIIDERYSDDGDAPPPSDNPDPFNSYPKEYLASAWPAQKSNIHWVATQSLAPEPTHMVSPPESPLEMSPVSPAPPPTPRSAGGTSFMRFLSGGKKVMDEQATEEKRIKKRDLKAKKEKMRLEQLKRDLGVHPVVMGGMMALG